MIWFYNYSSLAWPSWMLLPKAGSFMAFLRQENRQSHWLGLAMKQIGNENTYHHGNSVCSLVATILSGLGELIGFVG